MKLRDFQYAAAIGCAVMLAGCTSGSTPSMPAAATISSDDAGRYGPSSRPAPIMDADIDAHIDASLPDDVRKTMHRIMLGLMPSDRYSVAFFAKDGTNYANTRSTLATMRRWKSRDGVHFDGDGGEQFIGPPLDTPETIIPELRNASGSKPLSKRVRLGAAIPDSSDSDGPFRRVTLIRGTHVRLETSTFLV